MAPPRQPRKSRGKANREGGARFSGSFTATDIPDWMTRFLVPVAAAISDASHGDPDGFPVSARRYWKGLSFSYDFDTEDRLHTLFVEATVDLDETDSAPERLQVDSFAIQNLFRRVKASYSEFENGAQYVTVVGRVAGKREPLEIAVVIARSRDLERLGAFRALALSPRDPGSASHPSP